MVGGHIQVDVVECLTFAVPGVQFLDLNSDTHVMPFPRACRGGQRSARLRQMTRSIRSAQTIPPKLAGASLRRRSLHTRRSEAAAPRLADHSAGSRTGCPAL